MTKIGIYSTYSPQSSIHFLVHCSNFCKLLKKNSEGCPSNQISAAAMTSTLDEKLRPFNCFFQSREQVVVRQGQIRRIRWVIKTLEAQVGQFLLGCKYPVSWGIVVQEQDALGDLPHGNLVILCPHNILHNANSCIIADCKTPRKVKVKVSRNRPRWPKRFRVG